MGKSSRGRGGRSSEETETTPHGEIIPKTPDLWTGLTDFFLSYMWPYVDKVVEVSTSKSILPKKTVMQFSSGARNMFAATELQRQVSVKILNLLSNS
ncbi:hypothetical protein ISN44_As10g008390 [Arabidopsis suecica]|uniref:Uncharacterized protein n=1 Tax=Arabidopsis suecica TaxID=45249 RepID=A0A8T1ZWF7_ARASU|nr:hypothetical protein ISN44_As10g008290 [Arabidopsis suecica]KAG7564072.1 hypothetical protein ISN44_As10g008330 [Arabidopsis suecica]KAG7564077.1 hypothetical protein ISN44_As10g008390 [Arabidopsis suecica]